MSARGVACADLVHIHLIVFHPPTLQSRVSHCGGGAPGLGGGCAQPGHFFTGGDREGPGGKDQRAGWYPGLGVVP